jgi:hypothetical protein
MSAWLRPAVAALLLGLALLCLPPVAVASGSPRRAAPPAGFFGVVPQGPLAESDFERMQGAVETLRFPVYWPQVEPVSGVYDFGRLDELAAAAADHGLRLLPFVLATPSWLGKDPYRPPLASARARGAWQQFLRALVSRYGPHGDFWRSRSRRSPIRRWQVWNEPNFRVFWHPRPAPVQYAKLLALSAAAIRGRDPGAEIVLAGVAPVGSGFLPWTYLRRFYRVPGVKRNFDLVALHPYSIQVWRMAAQIELAREAMDSAGDARTPILITELSVASDGEIPSAFVRGELGQARYLHQAFQLLLEKRRQWRIAGVDWYAWQDSAQPDPRCGFCQGAGLLRLNGSAKPSWGAYRQMVRLAGVR